MTLLELTNHQKRDGRSPSGSPRAMAAALSRSGTPDKHGRSSFSSLRENDEDLAQAFTSSKISSYNASVEQAIEDDAPFLPSNMVTADFAPPLTQPGSRLHGMWYPPNGFKGWKGINVKGRISSKSFGDLQRLNIGWDGPLSLTPVKASPIKNVREPGNSRLESLPAEIILQIISNLYIDIPPNGVQKRNVDLIHLLLTSKTLYSIVISALYSRVTIPHSRIFAKFFVEVSKPSSSLGFLVRRLDFSHFNPSSLFSTASERAQSKNLTADTLMQCLNLTPGLREFLAQEYLDDDLSVPVLQKLFMGMEKMEALDFCGCSSNAFKNSFNTLMATEWPTELTIKRLSLHKCMTLPASVFDTLLPKLKRLTHLDLAGTRVTDKALASIPTEARITHLNLAKCRSLTAANVIHFLATHPAVKDSLVFLSLGTDARTHQLLEKDDVANLIPILPKTLKSLSLKGSEMDASHIPLLLPLTKHLEELAVGRHFSLVDANGLFAPDKNATIEEQLAWVPHTLRYLDLSDMWSSELDMSSLFFDSLILKKATLPLEVVEFSDEAFHKKVKKSDSAVKKSGWRFSEAHARSWLVRNPEPGEPRDDGRRDWKMGAQFWGMRKVPVAMSEVGGMYGSYMFGRAL